MDIWSYEMELGLARAMYAPSELNILAQSLPGIDWYLVIMDRLQMIIINIPGGDIIWG